MRKRISELAELKIKNCNLTLQLLQMQANQVLADRDRVILEELTRLNCNPTEWQLDERTWEFVRMDNTETT